MRKVGSIHRAPMTEATGQSRKLVHIRQTPGQLDGLFAVAGTLLGSIGKQTGFSFLKALGVGLSEYADSKMQSLRAQSPFKQESQPRPIDPRSQYYNEPRFRSEPESWYDPYSSPPSGHFPKVNSSSEKFPGL